MADSNVKLLKLLTEVLNAHTSAQARAEAAEAAALRLAGRMLADDHEGTFKKGEGFVCDERLYGDGHASYLTNAQGLVGVLLPFVEVASAQPTDREVAKIFEAAGHVFREIQKEKAANSVWFGLDPYVGIGSMRKAAKDNLDKFYSTSGVSWALSSLVLLYLCHLRGKLELRGDLKPAIVVTAIETTYDLLLRSFVPTDESAGWGWCSLSTAPDLYHTWSASQTLGDLEDYVFAPTDQMAGQDPKLHELSDRLRDRTPRALLGEGAKSPTDFIYRKASQWLYKELTSAESAAIKDELSTVNAAENDIYYTYFLIESLVYMHADQLLPGDPKTIKDTLAERLFSASFRLDRLRSTDWYRDPDRSTLRVPLQLGKDFLSDQLLEPSLEPLVMRALSYGPLYLGRRDPVDFLEAALKRHAGMLDEDLDLWDEEAPNFLICERTIESLLMVRNMFLSLPTPAGESARPPNEAKNVRGELVLTLAGDQVAQLVDGVVERLKEPSRRNVLAALASSGDAVPQRGGALLQALDPINYLEIAKRERILTYVDHVTEAPDALYQVMLVDTIVAVLTALLDPQPSSAPQRSPGSSPLPSEKLAEAFAAAVAAAVPKAIAKYLHSLISVLDDAEISQNFNVRRIEDQVARLATVYLQKEFRQTEALDVAGRLAETLETITTRGGGFA